MTTEQDFGKAMAEELGSTRWQMVGSTYILGSGNDLDYLFLVDSLADSSFLRNRGYTLEAEQYDNTNKFLSWRNGNTNVLVTPCIDFFIDFLSAAEVCKYLRNKSSEGEALMMERDVRVAVHRIVRDGLGWDEA